MSGQAVYDVLNDADYEVFILDLNNDKQTLLEFVNNNAIGNLIRESKSSQVYSQIQVGAKFGMQTLEQALAINVDKGLITKEEALFKCNRPNVLNGLLDVAGPTGVTNK